jgi:hypothetical protein
MLDPRTGATPNPYGAYQQQPTGVPQQAMGGYGGAYAQQPAYAYGAAAGYGQPGPSSAAVGYGAAPAPTGYGGQVAGGYAGAPAGYGAAPGAESYGYGQQQQQQQAGPSSYGQPPQSMGPRTSMAAMPGINPQRAAMLAAAGPEPAGYDAQPMAAPPAQAAGSGTNSGVTDAGWGARSGRPTQQAQQQGGW